MKNKPGFTLTEVMIVLVIMGILVGLSVPNYFKTVEMNRAEGEAKPNLYTIHRAERIYQLYNNEYWPPNPGGSKDTDADLAEINTSLNIDLYPNHYRLVITTTTSGTPAKATGFTATAFRDNAGGDKRFVIDTAGAITESGSY